MKAIWIGLAVIMSFNSIGCITCQPMRPRIEIKVSDDFSKPSPQPTVSVGVILQ